MDYWGHYMNIPLLSLVGGVIYVIEVLINVYLVILIFKRWKKSKIPVIAVLGGFYVLFLLFIGIEILFLISNFFNVIEFYSQERNIIGTLFPFFGGMSGGFFLLFIDYFENENISPIHSCVYGIFIGAFVLNAVYLFLFPDFFTNQAQSADLTGLGGIIPIVMSLLQFLYSTNFPAPYFVFYVLIVTLFTLQRIKSLVDDPQRKKQISYLQMTILFYYCNTGLIIIVVYQLRGLLDPSSYVLLRYFVPHLSTIIGSYFIYKAYVMAPIGLLQFQRMEKIMVISRTGLLLYSHDFENLKPEKPERDVLLSGGIFAILTLFSEMIESENIRMITFQNKQIMLAQRKQFVTFLVVDRISSYLWSALESFTNMFNLTYDLEEQNYTIVPKNVFDDADKLLKIAFGF